MHKTLSAAKIFSIYLIILISSAAYASPCGELIYNKHGKLRKYEILNLTIFENTKKNGTSTTTGGTTETTTASSDPGVSTGGSVSWGQSLSTRGACKWGGLFSSQDRYFDYIAQNMEIIKKEMALGQGGHLEVLASVHHCGADEKSAFPKTMQNQLGRFIHYNPNQSQQFEATLQSVVSEHLSETCHI